MPHRRLIPAIALASASFALCAPLASPAWAAEDFHERFEGSWRGTGTVERVGGATHRITCRVNGAGDETRLSIAGTCRAALIFTRDLGADVEAVPGSSRYRGTYRGHGQDAPVTGRLSGDTLELRIEFREGECNVAHMEIQNPAADPRFRITVVDELDGRTREITNLVFEPR